MFQKIKSKMLALNDLKGETRIIFLYRCFSLVLTTVFYLILNPQSSIIYKLAIIICLFISSAILNYLYIKCRNSKSVIKILVSIEMVGNVLILIPTGGLNSPYMMNLID